MSLQERLNEFIVSLGISVQAFERQCNISTGTASRLTSKSYATTFKRISDAYPQLNMTWLKTGEGEMLNPTSQEHYEVGVGIGKQQGGKNDFKIEIKESDDSRKIQEEERTICDLEREIDHLKELLKEKDSTISTLQAYVARSKR